MWKILMPGFTLGHLGYLPDIILADDPRPVSEQLNARYSHGGGYSPFGQGSWSFNPTTHVLTYPGDPPFQPGASLEVASGGGVVYFYPVGTLLAIVAANGRVEVTRVD